MCRFFAYLSPNEPCFLSDVLISPANAISKQCSEHYLPKLLPCGHEKELHDAEDCLLKMRNTLLNMDGMGIAWYTDTSSQYLGTMGRRPALYKSQSPPCNDFNYRNICNNTETHCLFAHIRASSGTVATQVNCHPFVFGRHAFMHNGVVSNFVSIRRELSNSMSDEAYAAIYGSTDSEHAAALYMTHLTEGGRKESWEEEYSLDVMLNAVTKVILDIMLMQRTRYGKQASPSSLNFCVTDGHKMIATRFRNHVRQEPPSLYWSKTAGRSLNNKYPGSPDSATITNHRAVKSEQDDIGNHVIVSSEPTTYDEDEWTLLERNHALLVDEHGTVTEVQIKYDPDLNFHDSGCCR